MQDNIIEKDFPSQTPNSWTGFRNVTRLRLLKVKN